jgi:outer membrane receptor protein involved in Fe transport
MDKALRVHGGLLLSFLLVLAFSIASYAQTQYGTVAGRVTDSSNAVVPGAQVTLTNTATGVQSTASTSSVGSYYIGAVPLGNYNLEVSKPGFKQWTGTFYLEVAQQATVNAVLEVGTTHQTVTVNAAATRIDTTSSGVSNVMTSTAIRALPLNGRDIGQLFNLIPGVSGGAGGARVNGMRAGSLAINYDGTTMVDRFSGGMIRVHPGIETVQEFRVNTVGGDARYDEPATVTMATRSGSNQIHGAAYEYIRDNTVVSPARLRTDPVDVPVPQLIRNEFGGYLGGPLVIPHIYNGKNKTFWFFDFEGLRDHERFDPSSFGWNDVPTLAMWNGDLSNAVDTSIPCSVSPSCPQGFQPITIYDPTTTSATSPYQRTPFPNNQIPGPLNKTAQVLASMTAHPTNNNNPWIADNFFQTYPQIARTNNYTAKVDQNISDKDRLSVRYTRSNQFSAIEGGYFANPIDPTSGMGSSSRTFPDTNVGVNYTRTISPTWLNELVVGVLRNPNHYGTLADDTDWATTLGLPNIFGVTGWPTLYTCEVAGFPAIGGCLGWDSDNNHLQHLTSESIDDNVTWVHGAHTFQFGFQGRMEQNYIAELQQAQGSHEWDPTWTALYDPSCDCGATDTGSGFAQLLLGLPNYLSNQYNRGYFYFRQHRMDVYVQDQWKVTPRLTLNLGLRWDYNSPYTEARNRLVVPYNPTSSTWEVLTPDSHDISTLGTPSDVINAWSAAGLQYATASSVGYPSKLFRSIYSDWAPRLGVAYRLSNKTVLRGSYGIYYFPMPLNLILQAARNNPPLNLRYQNQYNQNGANSNYTLQFNPAPNDYLPGAPVPPSSVSQYGHGSTYWDGTTWNSGKFQTWNLTVERELFRNTVARLTYVGTWGSNLSQSFAYDSPVPNLIYAQSTGLLPSSNSNLLKPNPNWSLISYNKTGYSHNNSAQVEIQHKFSTGMTFDAFYTFSRFLTTADPSGGSLLSTNINSGGGGGAQVPENYQILGQPNLTYEQRLRLVYLNSTSVPPHVFTLDGVFDVPFGQGRHFLRKIPGPVDAVIGGWQVATIYSWTSGSWMSVDPSLVQTANPSISSSKRATFDSPQCVGQCVEWFAGNFNSALATNVQGGLVQPLVRNAGPNCTGQYDGHVAVTLYNEPGTPCYNAPWSGFFSPYPRTSIIGPGAWNGDLSIYKHFKIGDRVDMRFAGDFFNAFNHPNDAAPNASTGLQDLGKQNTTFNQPRVIQLSLRLQF